MTDKPERVTLRKALASAGSAAPQPAPTGPLPRPNTVVWLVYALIATGVVAVGAAFGLFGQDAALHKNFATNTPPITNAQIMAAVSDAGTYLSGHRTSNAADASALATTYSDGFLNDSLSADKVSSSDISDQATQLANATVSALGSAKGTLTDAQIANVKAAYTANLHKLNTTQNQAIDDLVSSAPRQSVISSVVLLLVLAFVSMAVWRGRHWSRWAVIGLWVLASYTQTGAGLPQLFAITADLPVVYKVLSSLAAVVFIAAIVLAMLPASGRYFASNRPAGQPQRRGLFAPRPPRTATAGGAGSRATSTPAPAASRASDRSKSKQRTSADAIAKGADLARSRAKAAGKSRRTGA